MKFSDKLRFVNLCQFLQRIVRLAWAVCALGLLSASLSAQAQPVNRLALVIGNDNYLSVERLRNARNDAHLMANTLRDANFDVTEVKDLDLRNLWREIEKFQSRIKKGDDVVFFFAGHGVQIGQEPVLLPVDIVAESDNQVLREGVPLARIQDALKDARFALMVIDACRDNPFPKRGTRAVGGTRGLPTVEAADGMAIIMSATRGQKALDSVPDLTEANGLFTFEFVRSIRVPGVDLRSALIGVRERVEDKAKRVNHVQRPSLVDETRGNFYFFNAPEARVAAAPPSASGFSSSSSTSMPSTNVRIQSEDEIEQEFWNTIRESRDIHDFQDYTQRYPKGRFTAAAARQIRLLATNATTAAMPVAAARPVAAPTAAAAPVFVPAPAPRPVAVPAPVVVAALTPAQPAPAPSSNAGNAANVAAALASVFRSRPNTAASGVATAAMTLPTTQSSAGGGRGTTLPTAGEIVVDGTRFKGKFVQEAADRTLTGDGEIRWANGDVFVGSLLKGKRQGEGQITWASGQSYVGEWTSDQPNGRGAMRFPNGDQYEGTLVNGQPQGQGRMLFASGDSYNGAFASGKSHGAGVYVWKNGQKYEGDWLNDRPQGQGKLAYVGGDIYEGQVTDGMPQGQGSIRYASSDRFTGSFLRGKPHGQGRYNWVNGDLYSGQWQSGQKHGRGTLTWANGDRWEGEFRDDHQTANGTLIRKTP